MTRSVNFGKLILVLTSESVVASCEVGEGANFGSRNSFGDDFPDV